MNLLDTLGGTPLEAEFLKKNSMNNSDIESIILSADRECSEYLTYRCTGKLRYFAGGFGLNAVQILPLSELIKCFVRTTRASLQVNKFVP